MSRDQFFCGTHKSPKSVQRATANVCVRGALRHRSACACAACRIAETKRTHVTCPRPALLSGPSTRLYVLLCGGHPHPSLWVAADGAAGKVGELAEEQGRRPRVSLAHGVDILTSAVRPHAKRPVWSKPHVDNCTLQSYVAPTRESRVR